MSYFIRNGNTFTVSAEEALDIHTELPPKNFIIKQDQFGNLFLELVSEFVSPSTLYGNVTQNTERIISTFLGRRHNTGVALVGQKGSGKTLLAKNVAIQCAKQEIPCIIVNSPMNGDSFNKFLQDIQQPCMVLLDEFEKVYDRESQQSLLTLLDGVFPSRKLFILTCNEKWRIDSHMRNRPGRIYYLIDFKGLTPEFIKEYCIDNLDNISHIEKVLIITSMFTDFNFDMLKTLCEEMNRYNEDPVAALNILNIKPEFEEEVTFDVELRIDNKEVQYNSTTWKGNPFLEDELHFEVSLKDDGNWMSMIFTQNDMIKISPGDKIFEYVNQNGQSLKLKHKPQHLYDPYAGLG